MRIALAMFLAAGLFCAGCGKKAIAPAAIAAPASPKAPGIHLQPALFLNEIPSANSATNTVVQWEVILAEFEGTNKTDASEGDGDVKYHLGYTNDRPTAHGRKVHLLLSPNPSHLELVNPVRMGIVRSKQTYLGDKERNRVVPITLHGDAAFTGQGIVQETLLFAFTLAAEGSPIAGATLDIDDTPVDARCRHCEAVLLTRGPSRVCPGCGGPAVPADGDELQLIALGVAGPAARVSAGN